MSGCCSLSQLLMFCQRYLQSEGSQCQPRAGPVITCEIVLLAWGPASPGQPRPVLAPRGLKCGVWSVLPSHHHNHVIDVIDAVNTLYHITSYHIISQHITSYHGKLKPRTNTTHSRQSPARIIAKILG